MFGKEVLPSSGKQKICAFFLKKKKKRDAKGNYFFKLKSIYQWQLDERGEKRISEQKKTDHPEFPWQALGIFLEQTMSQWQFWDYILNSSPSTHHFAGGHPSLSLTLQLCDRLLATNPLRVISSSRLFDHMLHLKKGSKCPHPLLTYWTVKDNHWWSDKVPLVYN